MTSRLEKARRIVVKIGSALLVDDKTGTIKASWLSSLIDDLADARVRGAEIIIVSSGAIALGRRTLGLPKGTLRLEQKQAAAAVGQIALAQAWTEALRTRNMVAAQVLVTLTDTEERRRYLNARATLSTLIEQGAVPVINENDTVATSEIRYGDNDRLAARVASMMSADCLVLLSDIDGLYTAPPNQKGATFLPIVEEITPEIEAMAGKPISGLGSGGMITKIEAGKIDLDCRPFALSSLIEDITELLAPRAQARDLEIACRESKADDALALAGRVASAAEQAVAALDARFGPMRRR